MPHTKTAIILMVAFTLPGAAQALGLGEMHVDSALNEPLAAEIDIVGATAEDLAGITASVANNETFLRFGVERPAFLSTATFKIAMDSKGRPVLAIRSREAFSEPLISMLIDLRWRHGEVVRQYTLLLDPPSPTSDARFAAAVPALSGQGTSLTPAAERPARAVPAPIPATPQASPEPVRENSWPPRLTDRAGTMVDQTAPRRTVTVGAGATLRAIALSARGDAGTERTMIAIFRANPGAFAGNINRLRLGAELRLPSVSEVSTISLADAQSEIHAQMETWHASTKFVSPVKPAGMPSAAPVSAANQAGVAKEPSVRREQTTSPTPEPAPGTADDTAASAERAALDDRVQSLEKGLKDLQGSLERENDTLADIRGRVAFASEKPTLTNDAPVIKSGHVMGRAAFATTLALAIVAIAAFYGWRRNRTAISEVSRAEPKSQDLDAVQIAGAAADRREVTPDGASTSAGEVPPTVGMKAAPEMTSTALSRKEPQREERAKTLPPAEPDDHAALVATVLDGIDLESLNASYHLEVAGELDQTANLDAANTTLKIWMADGNAETMPLETPRFVAGAFERSAEHPFSEDTLPTTRVDVDTEKLQYKPLDIDGTVHHIQMPSILREKGGFKDRRTSLVDVLKIAVEREPSRRDLRMKLLETFFVSAASSRQGFLEVAKYLAGERDGMSAGEWDKIAAMGRLIAADNDLFAPAAPADDEDLVNCA